MRSIHILLVEDDLQDLKDITNSLDRLSILYQLSKASNADEAVEILTNKGEFGQRRLPDVVLIDISNPSLKGIELLRIIRSTDQWKHLKCFIITSSTDKNDREIVEKLGISGYIFKPLKLHSPATMGVFNLMIDLINFNRVN